MNTILTIMAFVLIVVVELPGLLKKKAWRELAVFSFFLALGLALALPQLLGFEVPNPNNAIQSIFKPISEWLE